MTYYVTMTDKAMSGWGPAKDKINKLVFICDTDAEARTVAANAEARSDMTYINITDREPRYMDRHHVQHKTRKDYPTWYKPNAF